MPKSVPQESAKVQLPKKTTGYHVVRDEKNVKKILKDGFSLKGFGKESGSADVGDPKGAYFFPSKSAYKNLEGWDEYPKESVLKADLHLENPYKVTSAEDYFKNVVVPATGTKAKSLEDFRNLNKKGDSEKIAKYMQEKGYDGILDKEGLISYDEPQIVVFDPSKIKNIGKMLALVMAASSVFGTADRASALGNSTNENVAEVQSINQAIESVYSKSEKLAPMIDKTFIKALIEQESTSGLNDHHRDDDAGKYGWVVGFTKSTWQSIQDKAKTSDKYKNLRDSMPGFDTPEDAAISALKYAEFLMRDHSKEQTTGKREWLKMTATELYRKYNGGGSDKGIALFDKKINKLLKS